MGVPVSNSFLPGRSMIIAIAIIAALYFGREVFVPIALAVLLTFALAPVASRLRRLGLPRIVAVMMTVTAAFGAILFFAFIVGGQLGQLAGNLPRYQENIQMKIRVIKEAQGEGGVFDRLTRFARVLEEEISQAEAESPTPQPAEAAVKPIPVEIVGTEPAPIQVLRSVIGPLIEPVATAGIVIVFVIFMLLRREDLRDRFIRLVGNQDLHRTTTAMDDAGKRVGQYLLAQLVVNVTYAIPVGVGLWFIGVPNSLLWAILALVLRFVPYIGPVIAAFCPLVLAIAIDPGWTMVVWAAALFIVLELVSNNIVEPILYGSRTGLSTVAIVVSAIFWTWLWGPIGLLLSTPLTVCMVVLGRHVPQFEFLNILLGNEPVLSPSEQLYQRLLAGDPAEATEHAEEYLSEAQISDFYDDVALPALVAGELDRARGALEEDRRRRVAEGALTLVENLSEHEDLRDAVPVETVVDESPGSAVSASSDPTRLKFVCAGGRGDLDDAAAIMLVQILERAGYEVRALTYEALESNAIRSLDVSGADVIVVGYLNSESVAHARYLVRRLRRLNRKARIGIAFWAFNGDGPAREKTRAAVQSDFFVSSIRQMLEITSTFEAEASKARMAATTHGDEETASAA